MWAPILGLLRAGLLTSAVLATTGAAERGQEMLDEYNRILNILIYAAASMTAFTLAWAGFTAMWDMENSSNASRAKGAVIGALSGLLLTLMAKGIMIMVVDGTTVLLPTR